MGTGTQVRLGSAICHIGTGPVIRGFSDAESEGDGNQSLAAPGEWRLESGARRLRAGECLR